MPLDSQIANRHSRVILADMDNDGDLDTVGDRTGPLPGHVKVYWNLHRQLYAPNPARIGQSYALEFHGPAGTFMLPAAAFGPANLDLGGLGRLGLDPATLITGPVLTLPASGTSTLSFQVPNDPSAVGARIRWQAIHADPGRGTLHLTNVFDEVVLQ